MSSIVKPDAGSVRISATVCGSTILPGFQLSTFSREFRLIDSNFLKRYFNPGNYSLETEGVISSAETVIEVQSFLSSNSARKSSKFIYYVGIHPTFKHQDRCKLKKIRTATVHGLQISD